MLEKLLTIGSNGWQYENPDTFLTHTNPILLTTIILSILIIHIFLSVITYRNAKGRLLLGAGLWAGLVALVGIIGLLIYFVYVKGVRKEPFLKIHFQ